MRDTSITDPIPASSGASGQESETPSTVSADKVRGSASANRPILRLEHAIYAATAFLVFAALWRNRDFAPDDTFITLRYARHLLAGYGPVWNIGGQPLEGFSSPLHLLLIVGVARLGLPLLRAAQAVNFTSHAILVGLVAGFLCKRVRAVELALSILLVAGSWPLLVWDLGGLDHALAAMFFAGAAFSSLRYLETGRTTHNIASGVWFGFALLTRPEAASLLAGFLAMSLIPHLNVRSSFAKRFTGCLLASALAALITLPWIVFRLRFYHSFLPNTYYAKMYAISRWYLLKEGALYVFRCAATPPWLLLAALWAAGLLIYHHRFTPVVLRLWMFLGISLLAVVAEGGDYMPAYRFLVPAIPLLSVLVVLQLHDLGVLVSGATLRKIVLCFLTASALQADAASLNPVRDPVSLVASMVGRYIRVHWPAGSIVALNTAGSTPFEADNMSYIDMLGLNDAEIARRSPTPVNGPWTRAIGHLKGDGSSVLRRRPDYIILGPSEGTTPEIRNNVYFRGDYEIGNSAYFRQNYHVCSDRPNSPDTYGGSILFTYYQRNALTTACPHQK